MLEDRLAPVLAQLRAQERGRHADFEIVREWFSSHEENLADNVLDMTFLCRLPHQERTLLTYPVIGNWYLDKMSGHKSQTPHQQKIQTQLMDLIREYRFNNSHMRSWYGSPEEYNKNLDKLHSMMLSTPRMSQPLHERMEHINREFCDTVHEHIEKVLRYSTKGFTIDLGHGLMSPSGNFEFLTMYFAMMMERRQTRPLDLTIMVVDDEHPEAWYQRLISVGFKDQKGQQGYFFDCESALEALTKAHYDVILTDLELGKGKMGGIEFVEKAYDIQEEQGIVPRISVFSYNDEMLQEAEDRFRGNREVYKVFHQVNYNNKKDFTAIRFSCEVAYSIR
jgi:CheY-like chemotaxis protein